MNIKEVAKLAGVSKSTVSRVLNDSESVTEHTRQKVLRVIESINFLPNSIARSLKGKKTKTIGVIVPDIGNPFYFEVLKGIEKVLDKKGFNIILCNSEYNDQKELKYISLLASKKADGIIFAAASNNSSGVKKLVIWDIPFVVLDIPQKNISTNIVMIDHSEASFTATKYLIENGHKEIAIIDLPRRGDDSAFIIGYKRALSEFKISVNDKLIIKARPDIYGSYVALKGLLLNKIKFSSVIAISDIAAVGAYKLAEKFKLKIPQDISVIGNDDIPLAKYLNPSLTTMRHPKFLLGLKGAELLLENILNNKTGTNPVKTVALHIKFILRDSVSSLKK